MAHEKRHAELVLQLPDLRRAERRLREPEPLRRRRHVAGFDNLRQK